MSRLSFTPTGARLCTDKQKVSSSKAQVAQVVFCATRAVKPGVGAARASRLRPEAIVIQRATKKKNGQRVIPFEFWINI